ncbi:sulfatase-like hydrolase/transferase [Microbacterium awajiense]|uniref:Sulfatase-like hydrolase/transferase n=1 Tax=Microbacterium awajiense TaxID=415214 RepID=A0ABP7AUJ1_9MICO
MQHNMPIRDVLVIYTDQWRWDALGSMGSPAQTPHLDALAARGTLFDHAFVQSPVCMPSRVSMLTGRYPSNLGITHMGVPVPESIETVASTLSRRGWHTANVGKLHFLPHANRDHSLPHPRYGFDVLALSDEPGVYEDDYRAWVRATCPAALDELSSGLPPAADTWQQAMSVESDIVHQHAGPRDDYAHVRTFEHGEELTHSAWVGTRTVEHLRSLSPHERSFTIASFFSPHAPYHVPQRFLDLYDLESLPLPALTDSEREHQASTGLTDERLREIRHGYFAAISEVDHQVGRILAELDRSGRAASTLVVFTSDHGEWLGDHLRLSKGFPADDAVSRVPLIVSAPDHPAAQRENQIVEAVDIAPTVLTALGVPVPPTMQGRSLLPLVHGTGTPASRGPQIAITEHLGWRSIRTPDYRYVITRDGSEHLWDLSSNPLNEVEVDVDRASLLAEHRRRLVQRTLEVEQPLPRTWAY